jgi:predicted transcriptional regulator
MERLRKKGFLRRERVDGIYKYSGSVPKSELMRGMVGDFVKRVLGNSITPFVAYLLEQDELKAGEVEELKNLVQTLDARQREKRP